MRPRRLVEDLDSIGVKDRNRTGRSARRPPRLSTRTIISRFGIGQETIAIGRGAGVIGVAETDAVAADPQARNPNLKRLQASSGYRLRVGDWRVFYSLDAKARTSTIEGVEPRGGAYQ